MKYKALMLDVDGTLITYDYEASPTKKVIEAIKKAQEKVTVCLVTGRSLNSVLRIYRKLELTRGYASADNGALIVDLITNKTIYEQFIENDDLEFILKTLTDENITFYIKDERTRKDEAKEYLPYEKGMPLKNVSMIFTDEVFTLEQTHTILKKLNNPSITINRGRHKDPNKYSFHITHVKATKMYGIQKISELLNIKHEEIIGVGDSYNDFPLLMASGLKVAMGNAIDDLKEVADYIAPSVDDDGVAKVIEKYILES